jgi:hypothetical protein
MHETVTVMSGTVTPTSRNDSQWPSLHSTLLHLSPSILHQANATKSTHVTFTTRRATCPPVHINDVQLPQTEDVKYLELHLDRILTWHKHIFTKKKQLGLTLTKMHWLLGRQSKLSTTNKLSFIKQFSNPSGPTAYNSGIRLPPPALKS